MLIRTIALHSPSTSLGYTNNTLEGEISQMILFGSAVTCTGARIEVKKKKLKGSSDELIPSVRCNKDTRDLN